jgi:transcriptional regulator with XRE-family HTH domain
LEIGERIKEARRALKKTQQAFADTIGLKRNTIASYEIGNVLPSDRTIADICREFNVNEEWLRTGEGEMFLQRSRDEELAAFFGDVLSGQQDFKRRLLAALSRLDEREWDMLEDVTDKLLEELKNEKEGQDDA